MVSCLGSARLSCTGIYIIEVDETANILVTSFLEQGPVRFLKDLSRPAFAAILQEVPCKYLSRHNANYSAGRRSLSDSAPPKQSHWKPDRDRSNLVLGPAKGRIAF
jgi:hypothetical protein